MQSDSKAHSMRAMHEHTKNMTDDHVQVKLSIRTLISQREAEGEGKVEG